MKYRVFFKDDIIDVIWVLNEDYIACELNTDR